MSKGPRKRLVAVEAFLGGLDLRLQQATHEGPVRTLDHREIEAG